MIRRILAAATLAAAAVALLIFAWPSLFGAQQWPIVAHVVALRGLALTCAAALVIVLLLISLLSAAARGFTAALALVLVLFIGLNGAVIASRGIGPGTFETKSPGDLTVLTWNTLGDSPSAEQVAQLILETDADIVALPETTRGHAAEIASIVGRSGHPMWAHTYARDEITKSRSTSLLTSAELGTYTFRSDASPTRQFPTLVARPDSGQGPTIIAVHAVAPIPRYLDSWRDDLRNLATLCTGNVIMAGDFNATLDHFAALTDTPGTDLGDCRSAASAAGSGSVGTWPTSIPGFLGAPIDHVMATDGWRITGARVVESHDKSGSDHRPVVAQLQALR